MKKLLIGLLFLCACDGSTSKELTADKGKVSINGKDCEVIKVNIGGIAPILFVDCGAGSSSVTYQVGKQTQTVGQYTPPVEAGCPDNSEERRKLEEIKKAFYK